MNDGNSSNVFIPTGMPMTIVHVIPGAGPGSFGGGSVALNLAREQIAAGVGAELWSLDSEADRQWAAASSGLPSEKIRSFTVSQPSVLGWSRAMERTASLQAADISVVHQHALWTGLSRIASRLRDRHGIPALVTPHGALEKWALRKSVWKKEIALALYERNNLHNATCLHACSEQEKTGFREYGLKNPIAVIPNGVSTVWLESSGDAEAFRSRYNLPAQKRIMLFLSRVTPVKGLPMLMDALQSIRNLLDDWIVVIAGSGESDHLKEVQERIQKLHLEDYIYFTGPLFDQVKRDAFAAAELFVLPTKRENYGIVVAEALGAGVPVLTTKGAPWESLVTRQCGWWVDVDSDALAGALKSSLASTPDTLRVMGERGKQLVVEEHTWARRAKMTIELYQWLLGHRGKPDFVSAD